MYTTEASSSQASTAGSVIADLTYVVDTGEPLVNETYGPDNIARRYTGTYEQRPMTIRNGRPQAADFRLDVHGFEFVAHPTAVSDFFDAGSLEAVYYPEVQRLVEAVTGAKRVVVFDHTLRSGDAVEREARRVREPVLSVHNDYTEWSGPQRVRDLLPDEADELLTRRFAIVQVWRAIDRPIERNPLAVADARTLAPADLIVSERRYPGRIGQTYRIAHNPLHAWYCFPQMRRDEALVFKVFDSARDGRARFTAHTSFEDPRSPADAPARQSIEARTLAFFD
jgi:hypothetical protein